MGHIQTDRAELLARDYTVFASAIYPYFLWQCALLLGKVNHPQMVTFLFWNLKKNRRLDAIDRLVKLHQVDMVMLAESSLSIDAVLRRLNSTGHSDFHFNSGNCERIAIYSRFPGRCVHPVHETERVTIRRVSFSPAREILLAAVHLHSKLHRSSDEQAFAVGEVASDITRMESKVGHARTLLVGDLNMNPFEHGLVAATCLHATMDRRIAERGARTVDQKRRAFFYNPMWSLLGDASPGPPGTYYRSESGHVAYFWHMFDQVLIRPDLLPAFDNNTLKIIDTDGTTSFLKNTGTPDESSGSDHLPILFRLDY